MTGEHSGTGHGLPVLSGIERVKRFGTTVAQPIQPALTLAAGA